MVKQSRVEKEELDEMERLSERDAMSEILAEVKATRLLVENSLGALAAYLADQAKRK